MATITPIEGRTIHQIQSGQVIVDLCSVAKELVENCLDAKATSIEIRFKNQGLDSIDVQDNGHGITPQNYETVALKHHTSKLSTYSDLTTLSTFGFRGEALSSLCALSTFTITTCLASDTPKGTKLDFGISGKLKSTSVVAAQKGTTVSVENLFNNLPVRRRELERNIKREWGRVIGLLGQYACIQTGVKISVTQQSTKGKRTTVFSTKGNASTRENIVNVFGAKTLTALLPLNLKLELEPTSAPSQRWNTHEDGGTKEIRIVGYVSRPASGEGRQTPDRQMFFVNTRPCNLPQMAKAFNEVYKAYNNSQSPFIFASIEMDTHLYDINVSPDKRTILLHDQARMIEHLKSSLTELFESQDHTVPVSQLLQKQSIYRQLTIERQNISLQQASQKSIMLPENGDNSNANSTLRAMSQDTGEDGPCISHKMHDRCDATPVESISRDIGPVNLFSNWLGRETNDGIGQRYVNRGVTSEKISILSKNKLSLVKKLGEEGLQAKTRRGSVNTDLEISDTALPVPDVGGSTTREVIEINSTPRQLEEPIPAIISPTRRTISTTIVGSSPSPAKPVRMHATVATIKIGERTVTSSLGTPYPKRPQMEKAAKSVPYESSFPSFGNLLSQRFSASNADESRAASIEPSNSPSLHSSEAASRLVVEDPNFGEKMEDNPRGEEPEIEESSVLISTNESDGDYIDEDTKKLQEEAKVQEMIRAVEEESLRPSGNNVKRAQLLLKGGAKRKNTTLHLIHSIDATVAKIDSQLHNLTQALNAYHRARESSDITDGTMGSESVEDKLSLIINKSDFASMKIIGQFNLGFILASRSAVPASTTSSRTPIGDDLFIIDQHASDEKYNFERLQSTTIVQSQRLVRPKTLDLTAIEEEIVIENLPSLETNGFLVTVDESGTLPVGRRCQLVSLPVSRETTFSLLDLEELISLLADYHRPLELGSASAVAPPRPSKVRKMFAMRACRSSIMVGRTLTCGQMAKVVKHMGEIDKPWNCPHGRPTMRHLCNLAAWDEISWREGNNADGLEGPERDDLITDWAGYVRQSRDERLKP